MRKMMAALAVAGPLLLGVAAANPALAQALPVTLLCSPSTNGGTLVHGVCVLPSATVGHPYEGFLLTGNGAVDTFTITAGSLPPGLFMPATYGASRHDRRRYAGYRRARSPSPSTSFLLPIRLRRARTGPTGSPSGADAVLSSGL